MQQKHAVCRKIYCHSLRPGDVPVAFAEDGGMEIFL